MIRSLSVHSRQSKKLQVTTGQHAELAAFVTPHVETDMCANLQSLTWLYLRSDIVVARLTGAVTAGGNMQRVVICLALLACLLHSSAAFDWQPCSDSSKTADINKVSLTPEEPAAGDTVKFLVDGTASAPQLHVFCSLGIHFHPAA